MAKANVTLDAYWIGGTIQLNEQGKATKILCEWDAKDAESIRKVLAKVPGLPVDRSVSDGESGRRILQVTKAKLERCFSFSFCVCAHQLTPTH